MRETYRSRLGTTDDGSFVVVDVLITDERNGQRVCRAYDHGPDLTAVVELSVTGGVYGPDCSRAGQVLDALAEITQPAPGWTLDEIAELRALWERWHLNLMRAGCVHQGTLVWRESPGYGVDLDATTAHPDNACPAGYRYGSAWLAEEIPNDVLARVRELMRDRSADLYAARGYDDAGKAVRS